VNNDSELLMNVVASPEIARFPVLPCYNSRNAAEAFKCGISYTSAPWIIFCHQDVHFPLGSLAEIEKIIATVPKEDETTTVIGFAGLGPEKAGMVMDRGKLLDWPASDTAISIDEFCVIMHRDCKYKIDPDLGWHLWATDLCQQAIDDGHHAKIVRVLLHHNSTLDGLPHAFYVSAGLLKAKYPGRDLRSLNGV